MLPKSIIVVALSLACLPAMAINKCAGPNGSVVFQDAPCTGQGEILKVRPASGAGKATPEADASVDGHEPKKKPLTEAQRIEKQIASSQQERRRKDLETRLIPNAEASIARQKASCDREFQALKAKKRAANNNLAGATWEGSISSEMTAVATRCDTESRDLRSSFEELRAECREISGCK